MENLQSFFGPFVLLCKEFIPSVACHLSPAVLSMIAHHLGVNSYGIMIEEGLYERKVNFCVDEQVQYYFRNDKQEYFFRNDEQVSILLPEQYTKIILMITYHLPFTVLDFAKDKNDNIW
uniref:Uncharacterized protein n=1 Tax=Onchocerca volvulus TaxID=6282 RepID=A0A8R1Y488_ONCVO